jgi:hypothetical protein
MATSATTRRATSLRTITVSPSAGLKLLDAASARRLLAKSGPLHFGVVGQSDFHS